MQVKSALYTTEASKSRKQVAQELSIEDPSIEEAERILAGEGDGKTKTEAVDNDASDQRDDTDGS